MNTVKEIRKEILSVMDSGKIIKEIYFLVDHVVKENVWNFLEK